MNYCQFQKMQRDKFNEFPIGFAFSNKQVEDVKVLLGVSSIDECYSICGGGIIRKTDSKAFRQLVDELDKEKTEFLENLDNLKDALVYELRNHEFNYTNETEDTLEALGLSFDTLTVDQNKVLLEAIKIVRNDENEC